MLLCLGSLAHISYEPAEEEVEIKVVDTLMTKCRYVIAPNFHNNFLAHPNSGPNAISNFFLVQYGMQQLSYCFDLKLYLLPT